MCSLTCLHHSFCVLFLHLTRKVGPPAFYLDTFFFDMCPEMWYENWLQTSFVFCFFFSPWAYSNVCLHQITRKLYQGLCLLKNRDLVCPLKLAALFPFVSVFCTESSPVLTLSSLSVPVSYFLSMCWHREQAEHPVRPGAAVPHPEEILREL